ncbi:MAG: helix-turn-helix domain-containing protein [Treponema sp.]|nr:helix-turn-helix domain-containing protein [Treponema sp.]
MNEKAFWNRVKSLINNKGVTQEITAKACRISINTWRGWGSKNIVPSLDDCVKIAKYLDVSMDYLVTGKEHNPNVRFKEIRVLLRELNSKLNALK